MKRDYYIFSNGDLRRKDNTIYFVDSEGHSKPLPVAVVDNIHIMGQVDLNTSLLNLISQHGIRLHFYN